MQVIQEALANVIIYNQVGTQIVMQVIQEALANVMIYIQVGTQIGVQLGTCTLPENGQAPIIIYFNQNRNTQNLGNSGLRSRAAIGNPATAAAIAAHSYPYYLDELAACAYIGKRRKMADFQSHFSSGSKSIFSLNHISMDRSLHGEENAVQNVPKFVLVRFW